MAFGTRDRPGRVGISVRDFARFGLLYLRRGNWKGRQVITAEHAAMAVRSPLPNSIPRAGKKAAEMIPGQRTVGSRSIPDNQTDHLGSYSWLWWTNGVDRHGTRMWPDAPDDTFGAFGHGGPRAMWVIPSLDVVVSYNDAKLRGWTSGEKSPTNRAMKLLVEACRTETNQSRRTGIYFPPPTRLSTLLTTFLAQPDGKDLGHIGRFAKWAKVEIVLTGPESLGKGQPNPFGVFVDGVFTSPTGKQYKVPGFYDGDGRGGLDGNVWKIRFSADETGKWTFVCRSKEKLLDGWKGWFTVVAVPDDAADFYRWGRLEAVGTASNLIRYLKFRDGPYWLKAGCDDPENFLGRYKNYDSLAKRKAAVDYLAAKGINSLYMMTHNIGGDNKDVWPWLGETAREAMSNAGREARFDVAKLDGWRQLFEHMQAKGVVPYLVLEDDSAWKEYDHPRYYDRPMSAWENVWTELGGTRAFMESLPFWEMEPNNDLVKSGTAFCLAKPGAVYALYLPQGGCVTVELTRGQAYDYAWWKAANGKDGRFQNAGSVGDGRQRFTAPGEGDWTLRVVNAQLPSAKR